jgi:PEGA domain
LLLTSIWGWAQGAAYTNDFRVAPPAPAAPNPFSHGAPKITPAPFGTSTPARFNASPFPEANRDLGFFIRNRIVSRRGHVPVTTLPSYVDMSHWISLNVYPRSPYKYDLEAIDPPPDQAGGTLKLDSSLLIMEANSAAVKKPAKASSVTFESNPAGADVYIDGNFVGDTPLTVAASAGFHTISIRQWGYQTWRRTLTLAARGKISVDAILQEN